MRLSLALAFSLLLTQLSATYYSQVGQDKFLHENYFQERRGGVFVDIGAYDGVEGSNTYFFEKELGWSGLCIEPQPVQFEKLKQVRTSPCVQCAVAPTAKKARFLLMPEYGHQLSGLVDCYRPEQMEKIKQWDAGFQATGEIIEVECLPFNDLMEANGIQHINLLSIDTEGGEYEILASINWEKYVIDAIVVEDIYNDPRFEEFLGAKGYEFVTRLSQDRVFVRKEKSSST